MDVVIRNESFYISYISYFRIMNIKIFSSLYEMEIFINLESTKSAGRLVAGRRQVHSV